MTCPGPGLLNKAVTSLEVPQGLVGSPNFLRKRRSSIATKSVHVLVEQALYFQTDNWFLIIWSTLYWTIYVQEHFLNSLNSNGPLFIATTKTKNMPEMPPRQSHPKLQVQQKLAFQSILKLSIMSAVEVVWLHIYFRTQKVTPQENLYFTCKKYPTLRLYIMQQ